MIPTGLLWGRCRLRHDGGAIEDFEACYDAGQARLVLRPPITRFQATRVSNADHYGVEDGRFEGEGDDFRLSDGIAWMRTSWSSGTMLEAGDGASAPDGAERPSFTFVTSDWIVFETDESEDEALFCGGDIRRGDLIDLPRGQVRLARGSISTLGALAHLDENARCALSIAAGDALRPFAVWEGRELRYSGNPVRGSRGSLLFFSGYPYLDDVLIREGFSTLFSLGVEKLGALKTDEMLQARNAIAIYLDGRSAAVFSPLKVLAAFHLLEYFAKPQKFSTESIRKAIGVARGEAKAIKCFRNDVVHNNMAVESAAARLFRNTDVAGSAMLREMRRSEMGHSELDALNYIISLTDRAILRWVGYTGLAQHYLPTSEEALRRCSPSFS